MTNNEQVRIAVRVQPNASQDKIVGFKDEVLQVKIAAPPVKGRANQELIEFLSDVLQVSKSSLNIEKGATSKNKVIAIRGLGKEQVIQRLEKR